MPPIPKTPADAARLGVNVTLAVLRLELRVARGVLDLLRGHEEPENVPVPPVPPATAGAPAAPSPATTRHVEVEEELAYTAGPDREPGAEIHIDPRLLADQP